MHYQHIMSKKRRSSRVGFRNRMKTHNGRKMINRKRKMGRRVQVV
jgi:ribosomal protein L34